MVNNCYNDSRVFILFLYCFIKENNSVVLKSLKIFENFEFWMFCFILYIFVLWINVKIILYFSNLLFFWKVMMILNIVVWFLVILFVNNIYRKFLG